MAIQRAKRGSAGAEEDLRKGVDMVRLEIGTACAGVIRPCLQYTVRFLISVSDAIKIVCIYHH